MPEDFNRKEFIQWCKDRALHELEQGGAYKGYISLISDFNKAPKSLYSETIFGFLMKMGLESVMKNDIRGVKSWIEGFN